MGKLRFDAARERIETFRGKRNCTSSNSEDSTCHFLLQTAIQVCSFNINFSQQVYRFKNGMIRWIVSFPRWKYIYFPKICC